MIKKLALWESKHPKKIIIIALILLIPSLLGFAFTRVNYDIMSYLPDTLESVQGEQVLDEKFKNSGMSMVIVDSMPAKYTAELKSEIEKIDGVSSVIWTDTIADSTIPVEILPDVMKDIFYSKDESKTMMLVQYEEAGSSDRTLDAISEIKKLMNDKVLISGLTAITEDIKEICITQAPLYVAFAVILAFIAMLLMTDSWFLPPVVLSALGMAILYNMGTNIFIGEISFVTQTLAAILQLGVTMDYSIFLVDRYHEEKLIYGDRREAMANAIVKSITALTGSSLTTIFGFIALMFMQFSMGFDIGFVMAKGIVFGLVTVVTILPALVLLTEKYIDKFKHRSLMPDFSKINNWVFKHKKVLAIVFVVLLIPSFFIQSKAKLYYSMDKALPQDLISVRGLNQLKDEFGMASSQFIIFDDNLPAGEIMQMEDAIEELDGVTSILSYNSFLGPAIPSRIIPDEILKICKAEGLQLMMVNSEYSTATDELNDQVVKIEKIAKAYDPNALVTGEGAISKDMVVTTSRDFTITGIVSIAAIFILIAICFKSLSIPIILVLSIELAIWLNLSLSVIFKSQISFIDPTVINCVQLGATVDYAILLTTRFREELQNGVPKKDAVLKAVGAAEKSILQSASVFFMATFGVYLVCDITLIKGICALLARGSVISAVVIVVFTTPILYLCESFIDKTSLDWRCIKPRKKKNKKAFEKSTEEAENNA